MNFDALATELLSFVAPVKGNGLTATWSIGTHFRTGVRFAECRIEFDPAKPTDDEMAAETAKTLGVSGPFMAPQAATLAAVRSRAGVRESSQPAPWIYPALRIV
jgi:hypothetical protein